MPTGIRSDNKAKKIHLNILGEPTGGSVDSSGKKKKYRKKKDKKEVGSETFAREDFLN